MRLKPDGAPTLKINIRDGNESVFDSKKDMVWHPIVIDSPPWDAPYTFSFHFVRRANGFFQFRVHAGSSEPTWADKWFALAIVAPANEKRIIQADRAHAMSFQVLPMNASASSVRDGGGLIGGSIIRDKMMDRQSKLLCLVEIKVVRKGSQKKKREYRTNSFPFRLYRVFFKIIIQC